MDISAFLSAQFDTDEAAARAAQDADPAPWSVSISPSSTRERSTEHGSGLVIAADGVSLWDCEGASGLCMTAPTANHVARWDPTRVLAEVAAKRRILERHAQCGAGAGLCDHAHRRPVSIESGRCGTLRDLAAPYAGRPGFKPAWSEG